jgi:hypothetical protein
MGGQVRHPSLDASFYSASDTPLSESKRVLRLCMPQWPQWVMFAPEGGVLAYCKGRSVQGESDYSTLPVCILKPHGRSGRRSPHG